MNLFEQKHFRISITGRVTCTHERLDCEPEGKLRTSSSPSSPLSLSRIIGLLGTEDSIPGGLSEGC